MFGIPYPFEEKKYNDPNQLEIKFFFPLTEQIPLGLDYTDCEKPKLFTSSSPVINGVTGTTWVTTSSDIQASTLVLNKQETIEGYFEIGPLKIGTEKPNFIRKVLYKLLGFDWKKK